MRSYGPIVTVEQLLQAPYESYRLYYEMPLDGFYKLWQTLKIVFIVISFGCSIILAISLYWLLSEMAYPLAILTEGIVEMKKTGTWTPIEVQGDDDIAELTTSFNDMGLEIETQMLQLVKESEIKQQLVDDLAHELRTPLTAIHGYAEYLQIAPCTEEEKIEALDYIINESKRLSNMGQTLLTMAIYREDSITMDIVSSEEIIKNVLITLEKNIFDKQIKVKNKVKNISFNGDKTMLICLFRNLIENAIRASELKKNIWLNIAVDNEFIKFYIRDEGIGIKKDELTRITDAFYRVDKARSSENGGVGIGLSLCLLIVERHNGTLEFESKYQKGTTVIVTLPLNQSNEEEEVLKEVINESK